MDFPACFSLNEFNQYLRSFNQEEISNETISGIVLRCSILVPKQVIDNEVLWYNYISTYNLVVTNKRVLFIPTYDHELIEYYKNKKTITIKDEISSKNTLLSSIFGNSDIDYLYLPHYSTLAFFMANNQNDGVMYYINRRKSHSFVNIPQASLLIQSDSSELKKLIRLMKTNHLYAYRYLDSSGNHMYDYRNRLDPLYES